MAENTKNPLAHMLGAYLKKERNRNDWSTSEVAAKLGVSESVYRMFESGNSIIQPYRAFTLIQIFNDLNIQFDRLAKYLTCAQFTEYLMGNGKTPKAALYDLAERDNDFERFYKQVEGYFAYQDDDNFKTYLENDLATVIGDFLNPVVLLKTGEDASGKDEFIDTNIISDIQKMPTLTFQVLNEFKKILLGHPFLHIGEIAQNWEEANKKNFLSVIGLYKSPNLILDKENLIEFSYPYLFEKSFKDLRMIFVSDKPDEKLKNDFVTNLNAALKQNKINLRIEEDSREFDKIHFRTITNRQYLDDIDSLFTNDNSLYNDLRAFWQFTMKDKNNIGFIGASEDNRKYVVNLSYQECLNKARLFESIWQKIEAKK